MRNARVKRVSNTGSQSMAPRNRARLDEDGDQLGRGDQVDGDDQVGGGDQEADMNLVKKFVGEWIELLKNGLGDDAIPDTVFDDFRNLMQSFNDTVIVDLPPNSIPKDNAMNLGFPDNLPVLDLDSVVLGVIDSGVPIAHRRLRTANGDPRCIAAWQMSAPSDNHRTVPFGRELMADEIKALIDAHSKADWLDEDGLNRAAGLEDYVRYLGQRELGRRASHGAHVVDCAAGRDPEDDAARWLRFYCANLPNRLLLGLSGRFLEYWAIWAILRIVAITDATWVNSMLAGTADGKVPPRPDGNNSLRGFPIIITFPYGKNAGKREGRDWIATILTAMNEVRHAAGMTPVHLVIPAGNDNLRRGNMTMQLAPGETRAFVWRVPHEDRSANFVEVWPNQSNLHLSLSRPGESEVPANIPQGYHVSAGINGKEARIYCPVNARYQSRQSAEDPHYVICTSPTVLYDAPRDAAPGGEWVLGLRNNGTEAMDVHVAVQSDQSEHPEGITGLRSYFEREIGDPDAIGRYERFEETGRIADSYHFPPYGNRPVNLDFVEEWLPGSGRPSEVDKGRKNAIRRHGTLNAVAAYSTGIDGPFKGSISVAGYRATDGRPAPYSGTGSGHRRRDHAGAPTVAAVTDTGYAHVGTIGAGARDGSGVALSGTSFGSARMASEVAAILHQDDRGWQSGFFIRRWVFNLARRDERTFRGGFFGPVDIEKCGSGRRISEMDKSARDRRLGRTV